jgi:hypothetical protein
MMTPPTCLQRKRAMARAIRVMATATRVAGDKEGNGEGGEVYGDGDEEGKGEGCKSDGDGN